MASRYTRDEIIIQGLELASSATVTQHDMPGGILESNAFGIKWLQNALDMFHRKYPFATDITDVALTIPAGSFDAYISLTRDLPEDFIIDVRDGVFCTVNGTIERLKRRDFQTFLNQSAQSQFSRSPAPSIYCVVRSKIKICPPVTESLVGRLYYYALPPVLQPNDPLYFPDEFVLIEFIRLKALEWTRSMEPGTSQNYLTKQLAGLRASGLLHEPEFESVPIENNQRFTDSRNAWDWMGPPVAR